MNDKTTPLVPVRMVNEYVYCPRLAYMMWVQGEFAHSADTVEGAIRHKRVDKEGGKLPADLEDAPETIERRLANALGEIARAGDFRHRLINDDLQSAYREFRRVILDVARGAVGPWRA